MLPRSLERGFDFNIRTRPVDDFLDAPLLAMSKTRNVDRNTTIHHPVVCELAIYVAPTLNATLREQGTRAKAPATMDASSLEQRAGVSIPSSDGRRVTDVGHCDGYCAVRRAAISELARVV